MERSPSSESAMALGASKCDETRVAPVGQTSRSAADLQVGPAHATFERSGRVAANAWRDRLRMSRDAVRSSNVSSEAKQRADLPRPQARMRVKC